MKKLQLFSLWIVALLVVGELGASNLRIFNLVNTNPGSVNPILQFNLAWDNCWRTSSAPNNYDGVWLFVKYQAVPKGTPSCQSYLEWHHAKMLNTAADFSISGGSIPLTYSFVSDSMGIFIYPAIDTSGNTDTVTVQIRVKLPVPTGLYDNKYNFKVFGIEMVYIPTGAFQLGDGSSTNRFNSITVDNTNYNTLWTPAFIGGGVVNNIAPGFPKGYESFWVMKYELTQVQWVEFLNTLTYTQQKARTGLTDAQMTSDPGVTGLCVYSGCANRNGVKLITPGINPSRPATFACDFSSAPSDPFNSQNDGQHIAMNFLSAEDLLAYLDWAALRPMTVFEYEKICRGPSARVANEYAWGTTDLTQASSQYLYYPGTAAEVSQVFGNGLCAYNYPSGGPLRVGFSATATTNRVQSGSSYYGVQQMSGNVWEIVMGGINRVGNGYKLTKFNLGNGELTSAGLFDVPNWDLYDGVYSSQYYWNWERKGGAFNTAASTLQVSDRSLNAPNYGDGNTASYSRLSNTGGRGVR
jgi:formylglycine-generating enzyme required for sulfatase activity